MKPISLCSVFCGTCALIILIQCCQSGNHYCVNDHTMSIPMGGLYHRDVTIIPDIPNEPVHQRRSYRHCSWEITADDTWSHNSQIVLEGVNLETEDRSGTSNKTHVNILLNRSENVTLGMFQVKPLSQMSHISVQINWDPKTQSRSPVNLRILIPVAGLCSRDMLSFNGSCHAISTVPAGIMKAVERCSGDVRLASFTSMTHINEFIAANEARQNELPYKSPLDLSEWLRLGMFYRAGDDGILSMIRTESGCELMKVDKNLFQVSQTHGTCGAFKVNEFGKAVIRYGDCDEPMLALMSFPETVKPEPDNSLNCKEHLLLEIPLLLSKSAKVFAWTTEHYFSTATGSHENSHTQATISGYTFTWNSNSTLIIVFISLGPITMLFLFLIVRGVKHRTGGQTSVSQSQQIETQLKMTVDPNSGRNPGVISDQIPTDIFQWEWNRMEVGTQHMISMEEKNHADSSLLNSAENRIFVNLTQETAL